MSERPKHIQHVEALLNREIETRQTEGVTFTPEQLSMRAILYIRALRIIATRIHKRDIDEKRSTLLRPSALNKLGNGEWEKTNTITRQFEIIENARRITASREDSFFGGARKHQEPYLRDLIAFAETPPTPITAPDVGQDTFFIRGATVAAPTGSGKSYLLGKTLVGFGVGTELEGLRNDDDPRIRALIVEPSQTLVEELTGKVGDNSLEKFAPNTSLGAYYEHEKNINADAVVTTVDQFTEMFRDGTLDGQRFDLLIIDEAHHATEPKFKETLLKHWREGPVIGFTATPEYYPGKDVRDILPHRISHGDIVDYIEQRGILNAAQLFSVRAAFDPEAPKEGLPEKVKLRNAELRQIVLRETAATFMEPLIAQGRRGIVFCETSIKNSQPGENATKLAERLRQLTRPDGSPLRVAVAGYINAGKSRKDPESNTGIRKRYAAGELDIIVTSDWGREGLNENIDMVITLGTLTSILKFTQQIGRGTRLSTDFPITVYGHIFTPTKNPLAQSLFSVFGFEEVQQGVIIGADSHTKKTLRDGDTAAIRTDTSISLEQFPDQIRALLESINTVTVGEALFDAEVYTPVPKGYVDFDVITADVPGSKTIIRKHLREVKGFQCIGRYKTRYDDPNSPSKDGSRTFIYYFEPAAAEYIAEFQGVIARIDLQREFGGVDVNIVDGLANACRVKHVNWFYYTGQFIPHYKPHDVELIRQKFHETSPAKPTDYSRKRLAASLGINTASLDRRLLAHELSWIVQRRTVTANGKIRVLDHWSEERALEIIARIEEMDKSGGLPLYLVPRELAIRYVSITKEKLHTYAADIGNPGIHVRSNKTGRPPLCFSWDTFRRAVQDYGTRTSVPTINFSLLPTGPEDKNPERLAYAREVITMLENLLKLHKKETP